jgi:L-amino acid N-acyltransferase
MQDQVCLHPRLVSVICSRTSLLLPLYSKSVGSKMITIRNADISDLERLTEIYNWAVANTTASFDIVQQLVEARKAWFSHYGGAHPLIVAEFDGKIAGYSSLSKFREKEGYAKTVEISVYVDPAFHGQGIGKRLMEEIIKQGRELGHHVVMAAITADNNISIRMHEKLGFKFCGHFREVGHKFGQWQDCIFYQLIL